MERRPSRKLTLNRQTIRTLTPQEMSHVAGGAYLVPTRIQCETQTYTVRNCPNSIGCKPVMKAL